LDRNDRITAWCKAELGRMGSAGVADRVFDVYRACADLRFLDLTIEPTERAVGSYWGDAQTANSSTVGLITCSTLRTWLSMWSMSDSQCRSSEHLQRITQPALVVQCTTDEGVFPSDAQG